MKIFNRDDIQKQYYDLQEFVENLKDIEFMFNNKIHSDYIEQIKDTYKQAQQELDELDPLVELIENEDRQELSTGYWRDRI